MALDSARFFRKSDWTACLVTFLVTLIGYTLTLQPTVGLEDSGELIVASDYLGVPHPPGYPIWTILTWFFQWIFHGFTYNGHPNPAWAVNFFSAFAGAAACGVLALLISRSGMDLLNSLKKETSVLGEQTEQLFCTVAGISSGLLLAFSQGMWSQSVIAEVYSLNILFQSLLLVFLYRWMHTPDQPKWLFLCVFSFGLGITNHQTLMFMGLAIAVAIFCVEYDILTLEFVLFLGATVLGLLGMVLFMGSNVISNAPEGAAPPPIKLLYLLASLLLFAGAGYLCYIQVKRQLLMIFLGLMAFLFAAFGLMMEQFGMVYLGAIGALVACFMHRNATFFRDFFIVAIIFFIFFGVNRWALSDPKTEHLAWVAGPGAGEAWYTSGFWIWSLAALAVSIAATFALPKGKVVGPTYLLLLLGLAFYFYMPIASDQNPPINWGYPRTWQGFMHAIGRGQYDRVNAASVLSPEFLDKIRFYYIPDLRAQFFLPIALLAAVPFGFSIAGCFSSNFRLGRKNISWLITTLFGFLFVSIVFLMLHNPGLDIQSRYIGRTQYIQSHALYVIWIGYGLLLLMAYLETLVRNNPVTKIIGVVLVLSLPLLLVAKNYASEQQREVVGGSEQNGHSFGWQFGNWQLRGVKGIEQDLRAWHSPEDFENIWAEYPNKEYPQPMGTNAIFFGGTDPGRFVPTYMIYSAKVRPDVYLITQNALADNTYMNVMRDLYGDQIWIPSPLDTQRAFGEYRQRKGLEGSTGKIEVQGTLNVMIVNEILARMIFDNNQYRTETKTDETTRSTGSAVVYEDPVIDTQTGLPPQRSFYVEESFALAWMYPYLTPHGLIMKLNNVPTPITEEMIKNDTDFWAWYSDRLLNDNKFMRDASARRSFSKLRSALAGLYVQRANVKQSQAQQLRQQASSKIQQAASQPQTASTQAMRGEARELNAEAASCSEDAKRLYETGEAAYRQAIQLYDLSPESNFRLVNLMASQGRFDEAIALLETLLQKDEHNQNAKQLLISLQFNMDLGTIRSSLASGELEAADALAVKWIEHEDPNTQIIMQIAQIMATAKRYMIVEKAMSKYTQLVPEDYNGWINLGAFQLIRGQNEEMWQSLKTAIATNAAESRKMLQQDQRFNAIRNTPEFQQLIQSPPQNSGVGGLRGF